MIFNKNQEQTDSNAQIPSASAKPALVDTSVIIDGRIADIAKAGFAPGKLLIPRFVLAELQLIADSGDAMKRGRGRRGLEILHGMREIGIDMDIIEYDYDDIKEVDAKLVRLGRHLQCNVLTTDYNLNRVASIEGVRVLNINELANAVRPVIIPGEKMMVKIVQPGKEKTQGVGYLADGTMIVVDGGDKLIGQEVEIEITRVFQTVAGKMLFGAIIGSPKPSPSPAKQNTNQDRGRQRNNNRQKQNNRKPRQDNQNQPQQSNIQNQPSDSAKKNSRRPKRMSPTQKLENSLVELTGGDNE